MQTVLSVSSELCDAEYFILRSSLVALPLFPLLAPTTVECNLCPPGPPSFSQLHPNLPRPPPSSENGATYQF
jgi:hypothetical protein